jgi:N-acylglucosamine-6-phosphate 2-epimerase
VFNRSRPVRQNYSMVRESQGDWGLILVTNKLHDIPKIAPVFDQFKGGLVVSCQATEGTPMNTPQFIAAQAMTVEQAGAKAIRAQGIENVALVVKSVKVPVIGLVKSFTSDSDVYITPTVKDVLALVEAGADIVAVDATQRSRLGGVTLEQFYAEVRKHTDVPLLADVDSLENAVNAEALGFDAIATTLNGYTDIPTTGLPNIDLVLQIAKSIKVPLVAEGGFANPTHVRNAIENGAWAVCVGTAITNPYLLTKHFINEGI